MIDLKPNVLTGSNTALHDKRAKSSGFKTIGEPCGVRSAAWSQASR
jgi:hypothetical protein